MLGHSLCMQCLVSNVLDAASVMCMLGVLRPVLLPVLQVLISSMASFASIVVLLVLFWMVFSIVGLHMFGGLKLDIPWPNMDSLINSMINSFHVSHQLVRCSRDETLRGASREAQHLTAVAAPAAAGVQILNLENFQITMFSVIRATNYASSMFWLAWIIMGKFILLTLFLAVTLDAFERKYEVRCLPLRGPARAGLHELTLQRA